MGAEAQLGNSLPESNLFMSAFSLTLPFIEQENLQNLINFDLPWEQQQAVVASTPVNSFFCPSNVGEDVIVDPEFGAFAQGYGLPIGDTYGVTTLRTFTWLKLQMVQPAIHAPGERNV